MFDDSLEKDERDMWWESLPLVNACLNGVATILLAVGFVMIRRGRVTAHRNTMVATVLVSAAFLASYLTYHTLRQMAEGVGHTRWLVDGWWRPMYYTILISHVILAAVVPLGVVAALWYAARRRFDRHKRVTRVLWPIWMYVSVTGVVVYVLLYQVQPRLIGG
ncbi:MAG: DUF420 domain-containing protein [Phycisphaerales bacterium]